MDARRLCLFPPLQAARSEKEADKPGPAAAGALRARLSMIRFVQFEIEIESQPMTATVGPTMADGTLTVADEGSAKQGVSSEIDRRDPMPHPMLQLTKH